MNPMDTLSGEEQAHIMLLAATGDLSRTASHLANRGLAPAEGLECVARLAARAARLLAEAKGHDLEAAAAIIFSHKDDETPLPAAVQAANAFANGQDDTGKAILDTLTTDTVLAEINAVGRVLHESMWAFLLPVLEPAPTTTSEGAP